MIHRWFFSAQPELFVDLRRVNDEIRKERRREHEGDLRYRARVKRRMIEGHACILPSLAEQWGWRP